MRPLGRWDSLALSDPHEAGHGRKVCTPRKIFLHHSVQNRLTAAIMAYALDCLRPMGHRCSSNTRSSPQGGLTPHQGRARASCSSCRARLRRLFSQSRPAARSGLSCCRGNRAVPAPPPGSQCGRPDTETPPRTCRSAPVVRGVEQHVQLALVV
jgi:hypothetical protein